MKEYTILDAKEELKKALDNNKISLKDYNAIIDLLDKEEISPIEICEGYLPSKKAQNRHK